MAPSRNHSHKLSLSNYATEKLTNMFDFKSIANELGVSDNELDHFPRSSGDYRVKFSGSDRVQIDFDEKHPSKLVPGLVIDAGCSFGASTLGIADLYPDHHVVGIEIERDRPPRLEDIDRKYHDRVRFLCGDLFHLDRYFKPNSVSCIFVMNNLTYLVSDFYDELCHPTIIQLFVARCHTLLAEGGYLCISGAGGNCEEFIAGIFRKVGECLKSESISENFQISGAYGLCRALGLEKHPPRGYSI